MNPNDFKIVIKCFLYAYESVNIYWLNIKHDLKTRTLHLWKYTNYILYRNKIINIFRERNVAKF